MPETTTPSKPRHQSGFLAGAFAKLKQNLKRRLLRRSAVHQLRNTRVSLSRLIKTAQTYDATLNVGQEPTRYQYDELAKRKGSFCLDAVGPVTLEQIKRFLIDPVLPPERWTPSFGQVFVTAKVESGFMIQAAFGWPEVGRSPRLRSASSLVYASSGVRPLSDEWGRHRL